MMRHCDGKDPNLVRKVSDGAYIDGAYVPCECCLHFDDAERSVVYPHELRIHHDELNAIKYTIEMMPNSNKKYNLMRLVRNFVDLYEFQSSIIQREKN